MKPASEILGDGLESQPLSMKKTVLIASVFLLLTGFSAAGYSSSLSWSQPFTPSSDMPKHYSGSSTNLMFTANVDSGTSETVYLQRKQASDTSWSNVYSEEYFSSYGSTELKFNTGSIFTVGEGNSTTVTVNGNTQTIEVVNIDLSNNQVDVRVNGNLRNTKSSGDYFDVSGTSFQVHKLKGSNQAFSPDTNSNPSFTTTFNGVSHTITLNSVVDSNTVSYKVDSGSLQNLDRGNSFFLEGQEVKLTEVVDTGSGSGAATFELVNKYEKADFQAANPVTVSSGSYEYRVKSASRGYTDSIYFDVNSAGSGLNKPYVENVTFDGYGQVFDFESSSGIAPGSTVYVTVKQLEGDQFNLSLIDRGSNSIVQEVSVSGDGVINTIYSAIISSTLGVFSDGDILQGTDKYVIPLQLTSSTDFLSVQDNTYNFGLKIEGGSGTRNTAGYSVTTSGTNDVPTIDSVEASCNRNTWTQLSSYTDYGKCLRFVRVKATDSNDGTLFAQMNLTEVYDSVQRSRFNDSYGYHIKNGDYYVFNLSKSQVPTTEVNESGKWKAGFTVSDGAATTFQTVSWTVPWGDLNVDVVKPANPITVLDNESFSFDLRVECSGGECYNENESFKFWPDPHPVVFGGVRS